MTSKSMRVWCVVAAAVGAFGCGPPELAVGPSDATVTAGGEPVTFTATGGPGEYTWSLVPNSGLGTLSATEGSAVTFTPVATVPAASTGVITVTSGEESVTVEVTVTPRAVSGRVLSVVGLPEAGILVALAGPSGTFTTTGSDANGNFAFASVPPVYDLVVYDGDSDTYTVHRGLTRLDPVVMAFGSDSTASAFSARVSGRVSGGAFPVPPASHRTRVALGVDTVVPPNFQQQLANGDGDFTFDTIPWSGPATTTGTLHALQIVEDGAGRATGYAGYGKVENVGLTNGATLANRDVVLAPAPATVAFAGSVAFPAGATLNQKSVVLQFGPNALATVLSNTSDSSLDVPVPELPGATAAVVAGINGAFGQTVGLRTGIPLNSTGVTLTLPSAPQLLSPASGATNVTGTTPFSWAPVAGSTYMASFTAGGGGSHFTVVTTDATITLPDLSGLGMTLPRAQPYTWVLYTLHGMPSVDAFATGGYVPFIYDGIIRHTAREIMFSTGNGAFTTAP